MTKCDGETTLGTNNQNCRIPSPPDPNAFRTSSPEEGVRDQVQDRPSRRSAATDSLTERDEFVISHVARYRLLSYSQVHQFLLQSVDISFARRTIRRLARSGWLTTWEPGATTGGHARYALPTSRALRHSLSSFPTGPWAPVVQLMLPATRRRALELADGALPKWLPHQHEVNQLAIGFEHSRRSHVRWASTWDSPFPPRIGMFRSPQPDYVMVTDADGASPLLIFGEHDRASEPVERFARDPPALHGTNAVAEEVAERAKASWDHSPKLFSRTFHDFQTAEVVGAATAEEIGVFTIDLPRVKRVARAIAHALYYREKGRSWPGTFEVFCAFHSEESLHGRADGSEARGRFFCARPYEVRTTNHPDVWELQVHESEQELIFAMRFYGGPWVYARRVGLVVASAPVRLVRA